MIVSVRLHNIEHVSAPGVQRKAMEITALSDVPKQMHCVPSRLLKGHLFITCRSRAPAVSNVVYANSKKTDIKKQGLESIKNPIIKQNLMGVSSSMEKKGWTDPSGRKGKV